MTDIRTLHRAAMEQADLALVAKRNGDEAKAAICLRSAFEMEKKAADAFAVESSAEPTRSILHRSAATLALDCGDYVEAERLACRALAGLPPEQIAEELRDLLERVHFGRHLALRGVTLHSDEFQLSISGRAVGYGIAPTDAFVDRVQSTEKLIYRTAERKSNRSYRDRGRMRKDLQDILELYVSVPRAASFAVSFRIGGESGQMQIPGTSKGEETVDELLTCLELFNQGNEDALRGRIEDTSYYNNFLGLARSISPDGEEINLVGFTTVRNGLTREVALTAHKADLPITPAVSTAPTKKPRTATSEPEERVRVQGTLKLADSLSLKDDIIKLVTSDGFEQAIVVPQGMMSDIVKPLWDTEVVVEGIRQGKGKRVILQDIYKVPVHSHPPASLIDGIANGKG